MTETTEVAMDETLKQSIETITRKVVEALGVIVVSLEVAWQEQQERIYVTCDVGTENGFLIGKEGRMLEALKEIIEAAVSRAASRRVDLYLDIGSYWSKIEAGALEIAQQAAVEVAQTGRSVRLDPMHPMLRRYLHKSLQTDTQVETVSEGEGTWKRIVIQKKKVFSAGTFSGDIICDRKSQIFFVIYYFYAWPASPDIINASVRRSIIHKYQFNIVIMYILYRLKKIIKEPDTVKINRNNRYLRLHNLNLSG